MNILAVDTSGPVCSVAVLSGGKLASFALMQNGNTHSVNMMPMIDYVLDGACMGVGDVDYFACVTGPGSFTGVRIGVTAVKALSQATGKPCIEVNALEALAHRDFQGVVCPILDARRNQVYCAAFKCGKRLEPDAAIALDEYIENIKKYDPPYLFVGDGVPAYTKVISEALGDKAVFADAAGYVISAAAAAVLAEKMTDKAVSHFDLEPYYLRVSSAQREYEERQAKLGNKQ